MVNSILMGTLASFLVSMIAFEIDNTLDSDALYKIMFFSQLATAMLSMLLAYVK